MNHSCREAGADWSTCWHAGTCGCRPPAQLPQLDDSFPPNNRMAASYWLQARQSGPPIGWQTTVGAVLLAGCQCGVAGTLQHRISRLQSRASCRKLCRHPGSQPAAPGPHHPAGWGGTGGVARGRRLPWTEDGGQTTPQGPRGLFGPVQLNVTQGVSSLMTLRPAPSLPSRTGSM